MQVDMNKQLIRVGSLVMWNREHSEDYQCMGIVIEHEFHRHTTDEVYSSFDVLWADNDRCVYDYDDLWKEHVKVVKF